MLRNVNKTLIFLFLAGCFPWHYALAQDVLQNKVYRVTAVKRGDNSIKSQSNYAEVIPELKMYIPNAFTPNGDGINDQFGVKGEGITEFHLYVYDRWGKVIFETTNPLQQWDGTYKGNPVQQDTYVYEVTSATYGRRPRTGSVTLIR
jgi:gliding motility-associated-like protein